MTVKRKPNVLSALPPGLRPARWQWFHTAGAVFAAVIAALVWLFPANAAAAAGQIVLDYENAMFMRVGLAGLALWVAFVVRGQPWWHVIICLLIAMFATGQMVRAEYTDEVSGIPLALLWANTACLIYLFVLAWRPSVHERLEACEAERDALRDELRRVRGG